MRSASFVTLWAVCLCVVLGGVATVNALIDPLNRLGFNRLGIFHSAEFEYKLARLPVAKFDAILIGASTIANINPDQFTETVIFNAGFSGALPEEMALFIRANKVYLKGKLVIMGLDFFMFNERNKSSRGGSLVSPSVDAMLKYMVSLKTMYLSTQTVMEYAKGRPPRIMGNGARRIDDLLAGDRAYDTPHYGEHTENIVRALLTQYEFSSRRIAELDGLRDWARSEGIGLQVMTNPQNHEVTHAMRQAGYDASYMLYKSELRRVFPDMLDYSDEFSGDSYFFRTNSMYFNEATMRLMVDRALKTDR